MNKYNIKVHGDTKDKNINQTTLSPFIILFHCKENLTFQKETNTKLRTSMAMNLCILKYQLQVVFEKSKKKQNER